MLVKMAPPDERRGIIGSSTIAEILGISKWGSKRTAYEDYMGIKDEEISSDKRKLFRNGHILESSVADAFTEALGIPLADVQGQGYGYRHDDYPYMVLHPDRVLLEKRDGKAYALECKTARIAVRGDWDEGQLSRLENPVTMAECDLSLQREFAQVFPEFAQNGEKCYDARLCVPKEYQAQLYWYMAIGGFEGVFLGRLTDNEFKWYYMGKDESYQKKMVAAARDFHDRIEGGWVPEPETDEEVKRTYTATIDPSVEDATEDEDWLIARYADLSAQKKGIEGEMDALKTQLIKSIGDRKGIRGPSGTALFSERCTQRLDQEDLLRRRPDLAPAIADSMRTSKVRMLTVKASEPKKAAKTA